MYFLNIKACQHILLHQIMIFKKASYDPFNLRVYVSFWGKNAAEVREVVHVFKGGVVHLCLAG